MKRRVSHRSAAKNSAIRRGDKAPAIAYFQPSFIWGGFYATQEHALEPFQTAVAVIGAAGAM